jgi:hypothetical protein
MVARSCHRAISLALVLTGAASAAEAPALKDQIAARKIYVAKCAKCHRFYEPTDYTDADWRLWMGRMNRKSKLNAKQADLLNRYLDAYRAGVLPGKPEAKPEPRR